MDDLGVPPFQEMPTSPLGWYRGTVQVEMLRKTDVFLDEISKWWVHLGTGLIFVYFRGGDGGSSANSVWPYGQY